MAKVAWETRSSDAHGKGCRSNAVQMSHSRASTPGRTSSAQIMGCQQNQLARSGAEIQFRERALASLLAPESPPPACLHVGGAYQRFLFFFVPLDQAPHHVLITLLHFLHFYSSLPSLFVSHGEWRYCFSIFNSFSLFLFTINLKKLLSRKNYKYSLDNFVSYKKILNFFCLSFLSFT